jgi:hypothetical protein
VTAVLTAALLSQPLCWANEVKRVKIPSLPSSRLTVPALKAQVAATATPQPGKDVQVKLAVTAPATAEGTDLPVTVTVLRAEWSGGERSEPEMSRVTERKATVHLGKGGTGSTAVPLPLQWAAPKTAKKGKAAETVQNVTYELVLSSTVAGKTACSDPSLLAQATPKPAPKPVKIASAKR